MNSSTEIPEGLLQVGRVGRPHGIKGDIFIDLTTDRAERADAGSRLWIDGAWREITFSTVANNRWRVHFDGFDMREVVGTLTGQYIYAEPVEDPDVLWVHELIGSTVVEIDGTERGICVAVLENPAHDILELDTGALVPATFITTSTNRVIIIDPPDGLFDT